LEREASVESISLTTMSSTALCQIDDTIPKELERICLKALSTRSFDLYTEGRYHWD